jgi:hypothetical protein
MTTKTIMLTLSGEMLSLPLKKSDDQWPVDSLNTHSLFQNA